MNICIVEKSLYENLDEILILQKLAYQSEAEICNDYEIPPLTQTLEGIREDYKNQIILKAVTDREIIGSIRAYEKDKVCYIGRLIVHPDYQNKGIGKILMKNIEKHFCKCNKYSLFTGKNSLKNLYFYNSLGYQQIREEKVNENLIFIYLEKVIY
jgi:ribosomal protein S18 acetylase RimI-like enzyme